MVVMVVPGGCRLRKAFGDLKTQTVDVWMMMRCRYSAHCPVRCIRNS